MWHLGNAATKTPLGRESELDRRRCFDIVTREEGRRASF
jgi:hypothetical protein